MQSNRIHHKYLFLRLPWFMLVSLYAVFTLTAALQAQSYTYSTLITFNGTNGAYPVAGLMAANDTLYGTTNGGGDLTLQSGYGGGTTFSVPIGGGSQTVLADLSGDGPYSGLTAVGNTLYASSEHGGSSADGDVFSVPLGGGTPTTVTSFSGNDNNGEFPESGVLAINNTLYGTTGTGGTGGFGTVYSLPIVGETPTIIGSFDGTNGQNPTGNLTLASNMLFGTTTQGGGGSGTIFSVPLTGGSLTTVANLSDINSRSPSGSLALSNDGSTVYGTAFGGGASNFGTVFSYNLSTNTLATVATFDGGAVGGGPDAGPLLSSDGSTLFGTTNGGGGNGQGTVFSVPVGGGTPNVLYNFSVADGFGSYGPLVTDAAGDLFGTTFSGGANGDGTVFELINSPVPEPSQSFALAIGALDVVVMCIRARSSALQMH